MFEDKRKRGKREEYILIYHQPLFLRHAAVNSNGGETLLIQQLIQSIAASDGLDKNDELVCKCVMKRNKG